MQLRTRREALKLSGLLGLAALRLRAGGANGLNVVSPAPMQVTNTAEEDMVDCISVETFDIKTNTGSKNPYNSQNVTVHLTDGIYTCVWNGAAWEYYFGSYRCERPLRSNFDWVNQSTAVLDGRSGALAVNSPGGASDWNVLVTPAPSAPWRITAGLIAHQYSNASGGASGIVARESSTGKFVSLFVNRAGALYAENWLDPASYYSKIASSAGNLGLASATLWWFRITDDNVNLRFAVSADGFTWDELGSAGRTSFLYSGPDQIGFGTVGADARVVTTCIAWNLN